MKPKNSSFSFEKVFDKPSVADEPLIKINPTDVRCFLQHGLELKKLIESNMEKAKRTNASQILFELSFEDFKMSQEEYFDKFLRTMDRLQKRYVDDITLFNRSMQFKAKEKELLSFVKANFDDSMVFHFKGKTFEFPENIPKLNNAFEPVFGVFAKYYNSDKAIKVFNVISEKNKDFVDACRGEIIGSDEPVKSDEFIEETKDIFIKDEEDFIVDSAYINNLSEETSDKIIQNIYRDFENVKQDYKKLYAFINKTRETMIKLDNASSSYATERVFTNTILEICIAHLLAFQIKLDCVSEYVRQQCEVLWKAAELCKTAATPSETVSEAVDFAIARSIVASPTDKYEELQTDAYDNLEFEKLLTDCCIREALIISEGVNVDERLELLHENVFGTIIDVLRKIKNFIANNFKRFVGWFDKYIASTKSYLEKYKDLITKNNLAGFEPVDIQDYSTGIARIKNQIDISKLQAKAQELASKLNEATILEADEGSNNEIDNLEICQAIISDYTGKNKNGDPQTFAEFCKDYFLGGPDTQKKSAEQFSPDEMYNTCYNTTDLVNVIKNDQTKVSQFIDMLTNETQKAANKINQNKSKAQASNPDDKKPADASKGEPSVTKTNAAATYMQGTFFIELNVQKTNSGADKANKNPNIQSTVRGVDADDFNKAKQKIEGLPNDPNSTSKGLENQIKVYRAMATNVQTVLDAKAVAAETICSDYMKLIKISVSYYLAQAK